MNKPIAGFSLGWIFDTVPDTFCNILRFLRRNDVDAIELCLNSERLRHLALFLNQELAALLGQFPYLSIHLPEISWVRDDPLTQKTLAMVDLLRSYLSDIKTFVVHQDTIKNWGMLASANNYRFGETIAVEFPMDIDKKSGRTLEELRKICELYPSFYFVLDIQHAFENDPTGTLAIDAAEIMGQRLKHLHVSGQKLRQEGLSRHSFLYEADNRDEIKRVLAYPCLSDIPRISEGEFKTCDEKAVVEELNWLAVQSDSI